jgi:integrase
MSHEQRLRDYLTRDEVASLLRAAKRAKRHGARNHAMILIAYRHGLRASELVNLRVRPRSSRPERQALLLPAR